MTIPADVIANDNIDTGITEDAAVAALMSKWGAPKAADKAEPALKTPAAEADEDDTETEGYEAEGEPVDEDEDAEEGSETEGAEEGAKDPAEAEAAKEPEGPKEIADDMVAKVVVDGQEIQLTGAALKRLAGQEAALTQKSQKATEMGTRAQTVLLNALAIAKEDLDEYEGVNWELEQIRGMPQEWLEHHMERQAKAQERFGHLLEAAKTVQKDQEDRQVEVSAEVKARNAATIKALVPDWSDSHEASIQSYMISQGITEESAKALMDPVVKHLVNKARLYDEGKTKAADKIAKAPQKKTVQPAGPSGAEVKTKALQEADARLKAGKGSDDDAVARLMGNWSRKR